MPDVAHRIHVPDGVVAVHRHALRPREEERGIPHVEVEGAGLALPAQGAAAAAAEREGVSTCRPHGRVVRSAASDVLGAIQTRLGHHALVRGRQAVQTATVVHEPHDAAAVDGDTLGMSLVVRSAVVFATQQLNQRAARLVVLL